MLAFIVKLITEYREDHQRFSAYYSKTYPVLYKWIPIFRLISVLLLFLSINKSALIFQKNLLILEASNYNELDNMLVNFHESQGSTVLYLYYMNLFILFLEFGVGVVVIYRANHPLKQQALRLLSQSLKFGAAAVGTGYFVAYAPIEPTPVSNLVHTTFPGGRGYDFEIGDSVTKLKASIIASHLGHEGMMEAVKEYGPASKVLGGLHISNILQDVRYRDILYNRSSVPENALLGLPLIDGARVRDIMSQAISNSLTKKTTSNWGVNLGDPFFSTKFWNWMSSSTPEKETEASEDGKKPVTNLRRTKSAPPRS